MNRKLNCIMIVDDDEPTNFFTRMLFEELDCARHLITLQSGREALDYLEKSDAEGADTNQYPAPDLLLLDINMPAMSGWEFLEEYEKLCLSRRIIVVMLTTSVFSEDRIRAESSRQISGFENKPITLEKIKTIFEKYFRSAAHMNPVSG